MAQILQTRNLEAAARALAQLYPRVLVRNKNQVWNPIRLRRSVLQDLKPRIVMNAPEFDSELQAWNLQGGMLIYDRGYQRSENIASHQAQLISECPLSIEQLEAFTEGTLETVIIYRPPNWNEHLRCVDMLCPSAEISRRFYQLVSDAGTDEHLGELLELSGRFTVAGERHLEEALGVGAAQLWKIRNATFRPRDYRMVTRVQLRVAPEDRALADVYHYIESTFHQEPDCTYLVPGSALSKAARHWKVTLRDLERCGAIARKDTLFCYLLDELGPNWQRIERLHRLAREHLDAMIQALESMPEFSPEASRPGAPAASARSSAIA